MNLRLTTPLLWHALNHPPATHPLFWRTVRRSHTEPSTTRLMDRLSLLYLILFAAAMLLTNLLDLAMQSAALAFLLLLLALPIVLPVAMVLRLTLLSGSFFGVVWAMRISQHLARETTDQTFDLLALLPGGSLASAWAISTGCIYRQHTFAHILDLHLILLRGVMLAGLILMFTELLSSSNEKWANLLLLGVQTLTALTLLHIDFMHSILLAALVGIIVPQFTRRDARLWAAGGFLLIQVLTYSLTLFSVVTVLPALLPATLPAHIVTLAVSVVIFSAIRELLITLIWQMLLRISGTDDVNCIFSFTG